MTDRDFAEHAIEGWSEVVEESTRMALAISIRIRRAQVLLGGIADDAIGKCGLGRGEYEVLTLLRRRDEAVRAKELATRLLVTRAGITRRLDHLEADGLVTRTVDPTDQRGILVRPTTRGERLAEQALEASIAAQERALNDLSPELCSELARLLKHLLLTLGDDAPGRTN